MVFATYTFPDTLRFEVGFELFIPMRKLEFVMVNDVFKVVTLAEVETLIFAD